jgi:hypothetical protein
MKKENRGRYYRSHREYINATGKTVPPDVPCIHVSGSIRGMRKFFWGYECDVVRIGNWIYKTS